MPFIPGSSGIEDVYHTNNVYINGVPVALWEPPSSYTPIIVSTSFTGDVPANPVTVNTQINDQINSDNSAFLANTGAPQYTMPPSEVAQGNIPAQDQGVTPAQTSNTASTVTPASYTGGLIPFLQARLSEANQGQWNRTKATTGTSNPNILNIWKSLGMDNNSAFQTDVTPWCMGFVNFSLKQCGYNWCPEAAAAAIVNNPSRWNATPIPVSQAQPGDIACWLFNGRNHHVNFVYTNTNGNLTFIGGNQSGKTVNNNNPSGSSVTVSWPSGWNTSNSSASAQIINNTVYRIAPPSS